ALVVWLGEQQDLRLYVARLGRVSGHIVNEDLAALPATQPELAPVIGEPAVMRLMASVQRVAVDDLSVSGRPRFHVQRDKFVRAVAQPFNAQGPDIDKLLLAFNSSQVWRGTGFIRAELRAPGKG